MRPPSRKGRRARTLPPWYHLHSPGPRGRRPLRVRACSNRPRGTRHKQKRPSSPKGRRAARLSWYHLCSPGSRDARPFRVLPYSGPITVASGGGLLSLESDFFSQLGGLFRGLLTCGLSTSRPFSVCNRDRYSSRQCCWAMRLLRWRGYIKAGAVCQGCFWTFRVHGPNIAERRFINTTQSKTPPAFLIGLYNIQGLSRNI